MGNGQTGTRLAGRSSVLGAITTVVRRVSGGGHGAVVVVTGPPGIGKTAVLSAATELARDAGLEIGSVTADRLSQARPLAVASELCGVPLPTGRSTTEALFAEPPLFDASVVNHALTTECLTAARQLATGPGLLVVDDLQWADRWSLLVLQRMASLTVDGSLIVLLGARESASEPRPELQALLSPSAPTPTERFDLLPLDGPAALDLGRSQLGAEPGTEIRRLIDAAGGNPLLITQLLKSLGHRLRRTASGIDVRPGAMPSQVDEAVTWRLSALSSEQLHLLEHAAVLGMYFSPDALTAIVGKSTLELAPDVSALCRDGLLVDNGLRLAFAHDLVHQVVYERNPPAIRRSVHREVAEVLRRHGAPEVEVVLHLAAGTEGRDDDVATQLLEAADGLGVSDPAMALTLLDRAAELATAPRLREQVEFARAAPLAWSGAFEEAAELLRKAVGAEPDNEQRAELRWMLAGVLMLSNRLGDAVEQIRKAADETTDPVMRARLIGEESIAKLGLLDESAVETATRAIELGDACGDSTAVIAGHSVIARDLSRTHEYEAGVERTAAAVAVAESDSRGHAHRFTPWFYHGLMLLDVEDSDGVANAVRMGRSRMREQGNEWADPLYCGLAASLAFREAAFDEASAEALAGIAMGQDRGTLPTLAWCHALEAHISLFRGLPDAAADHVTLAQERLAAGGAPLGIDFVHRADALVHEARGAPDTAMEILRDTWHGFEVFAVWNCQPLIGPDLVRLATALGDHETAQTVRTSLDRLAGLAGSSPAFPAIAERARGLATNDPDLLVSARDLYPSGRVLDRTLTTIELVESLAGHGRAREAALHAGPLMEQLAAMDAQALRERITSAIPDLDVAPTTDRAEDGWNRLTNAEREVARLVAAGATNAEIAERRGTSVRTVETHLYRTYFKLGVSSRTKLAVEVAQRLDIDDAQQR